MDLSKLVALVEDHPEFVKLVELMKNKGEACVSAIPSAWPYLTAALRKATSRPVLLITASPDEARRFHEQVTAWAPSAQVLLFPEPETLPYERVTPDLSTVQARLKVLSILNSFKTGESASPNIILIASVYAVACKTIPSAKFSATSHKIRAGDEVNTDELLKKWDDMGYESQPTVDAPGSFSRRGGILDIYPYGETWPVRIELFGNKVDSLRYFDPASQRSKDTLKEFTIEPAMEMLAPHDIQERVHHWQKVLDLSQCHEDARQRFIEELEMLKGGQKFAGMAFYAPLFETETVLDYLPDSTMVISEDLSRLEKALDDIEKQGEEFRQAQVGKGELPAAFPSPYTSWHDLKRHLKARQPRVELAVFQSGEKEHHNFHTFDFQVPQGYALKLQNLIKDIVRMKQESRHVIVISHQAPRLSKLLEESDIIAPVSPDIKTLPAKGEVCLVQGMLDGGFIFRTGGEEYILFTDREIFGFVKQGRSARKRTAHRVLYLSELEPGDFVVHADHGVARFGGTTKLSTGEAEREYLILEYAAGDKLYVPIDQIDRVTRYVGGRDDAPNLSRLGTQEWHRTRQKAQEAVELIARELLELYAQREVKRGYSFSPDTVWQQELEASFPYVETPDQLEAIRQVKEDMESPKPMDRLICGDVGYGKTEVALRAAFKCVMEGRQVAILVPTTILAHQHHHTFSERLKPFPIKVAELSRFCSDKEQQETIDLLKEGKIDICIGTHRLIQKDVQFKNLGLAIIDEEQRFGVMHKEYLKKMRNEVDVLTLTATPIPRTMHMALVSVRDMSLIETPPEDRLPIQTIVGEYKDRIVREAVLKELARNGQIFFVHNRIQGINALAERLRKIVPEAKAVVAHGQMSEESLENAMMDFSHKKTNVLISTTIIESGLDMPNVNTLIVNDADKFGLTQLYQLRGRVGRSAQKAYAYFLYSKESRLTVQAEKRLQAIFEASELGGGFHLAMKDLEIRGAGNLLGTQQSGQIAAVGFELYTQLLSEAVTNLKAARAKTSATAEAAPPKPKLPLPAVELPISSFIPVSYVPEMGTRLTLYQRMANVSSEAEIDDIAQELKERFGEPPRPAKNLLFVLKMRELARDAGVSGVCQENGNIAVKFFDMTKWASKTLEGNYQGLKVTCDGLLIPRNSQPTAWQEPLEKLLRELASLS